MKKSELQKTFTKLWNKIMKDTQFSSNPGDRIYHPNYQKILDLKLTETKKDTANDMVHIVIDRMIEKDEWGLFNLLKDLSGEDPVPLDHHGNYNMIKLDWLEWHTAKMRAALNN